MRQSVAISYTVLLGILHESTHQKIIQHESYGGEGSKQSEDEKPVTFTSKTQCVFLLCISLEISNMYS